MYMPGVTLTAEQICRLQHPTAERSKGGAAASARLLSIYTLSELPCFVTGPTMYLFDPSGKYITSAVKSDAAPGSSAPTSLGRAYPLVPHELPNRFPDQFAPLALFGFRPAVGRCVPVVSIPRRLALLRDGLTASCRKLTRSSMARVASRRPMDGTLIRLPLRSHLLAAHSALSSQFWSIARARTLVQVPISESHPTILNYGAHGRS